LHGKVLKPPQRVAFLLAVEALAPFGEVWPHPEATFVKSDRFLWQTDILTAKLRSFLVLIPLD